mmetsp:Transcript_25685/g.67193  ORF Transcript_25685/g.67193 Transcript_25685/m.67193 type:complete len:212 (-) Transcript_25685:284-919(-)
MANPGEPKNNGDVDPRDASGGGGTSPQDVQEVPIPSSRAKKHASQLLKEERARWEEAEGRHRQACGRQVSSIRPTQPTFSFAPHRVDERCREISQHPARLNPAATYFSEFQRGPSSVVRGWGAERRFPDDLLSMQGRAIVHSHAPSATPSLDPGTRYSSRPSWSFGSSGVGARFRTGTKFSKSAPASSSRIGFRERRESVPMPKPGSKAQD